MYEFQTKNFLSGVWKFLNYYMFSYVEKSQQQFNDFQICNAYMVARSIIEQKSLFININHVEITNSLIVPICLVLLDKLLIGNNVRADPSRLDEYMIYVDHKMMRVNYDMRMGKFVICYKDKRGNHLTPIHDIDKFMSDNILINKKYFVARKFNVDPYKNYIEFYRSSSRRRDYPPFEHIHKAIIICPKVSVIEELERYRLDKHFPFAFISSTTAREEDTSIKADPVIYFSPDYNAAMRFVEENKIADRIKYVVVMHNHNVVNNIINIKQDLAQKRYPHMVAISEEEVTVPIGALQWRWTFNDVALLTGKFLAQVETIPFCDNEEFDHACRVFEGLIKELIEEYNGTSSFKPILFVYLNMLRDKLGMKQDISINIEQALAETMEMLVYEGYNAPDIENDILKLKEVVLDLVKHLNTLDDYLDANFTKSSNNVFLVVPHSTIYEWQQAVQLKGFDEIQLIADNKLPKILSKIDQPREFYFTFVPHYKNLAYLLSYPLQASVLLLFSLSNAEIAIINRYLLNIRNNYNDRRKYIAEWYPYDNKVQSLSIRTFDNTALTIPQLIDSSYFEDEYQNMIFTRENSHKQFYISVVDECETKQILKLSGTTSVIRVLMNDKQLCQVAELSVGDLFRLYSNPSKMLLYDILSTESDKFIQIESLSSLWKAKLREYVNDVSDDGNGTEFGRSTRITNLAKLLGISADYIDKEWLSKEGTVKFPQRKSLIKILGLLLKEGIITASERTDILIANRAFSSIMIKLGHNLSSEIHRVILNTNEENIQDYISSEVFNREDKYLCLSQFDVKSILAIIKRNTPSYRVINIEEEEKDAER